jgi:hypothetical protein
VDGCGREKDQITVGLHIWETLNEDMLILLTLSAVLSVAWKKTALRPTGKSAIFPTV